MAWFQTQLGRGVKITRDHAKPRNHASSICLFSRGYQQPASFPQLQLRLRHSSRPPRRRSGKFCLHTKGKQLSRLKLQDGLILTSRNSSPFVAAGRPAVFSGQGRSVHFGIEEQWTGERGGARNPPSSQRSSCTPDLPTRDLLWLVRLSGRGW